MSANLNPKNTVEVKGNGKTLAGIDFPDLAEAICEVAFTEKKATDVFKIQFNNPTGAVAELCGVASKYLFKKDGSKTDKKDS